MAACRPVVNFTISQCVQWQELHQRHHIGNGRATAHTKREGAAVVFFIGGAALSCGCSFARTLLLLSLLCQYTHTQTHNRPHSHQQKQKQQEQHSQGQRCGRATHHLSLPRQHRLGKSFVLIAADRCVCTCRRCVCSSSSSSSSHMQAGAT